MKLFDTETKHQFIRKFLRYYLLPLCGKTDDYIRDIEISATENLEDNTPYSFECNDCEEGTKLSYNKNIFYVIKGFYLKDLDKDLKSIFTFACKYLFDYICDSSSLISSPQFLTIKKCTSFSNSSMNDVYVNHIFETSIQKSLCRFLTKNDSELNYSEKFLEILENWSKRTYEGHKVCYGFLVDMSDSKKREVDEYSNNFLDFLDDEYSAVLSDGISSAIKLNARFEFVSYVSSISLFNKKTNEELIKNNCLPYRFFQIIANFVVNDIIGVFLLQNGDIIIAKNKEIRFVKRNGKWMNFSKNAFIDTIKSDLRSHKFLVPDDDLLKSIYETCVDVSFSHTGGIISYINDYDKILDDKIINKIDIYVNDDDFGTLFKNEFLEKYTKLIENFSYLDKPEIKSLLGNESFEKKKFDKLIKEDSELVSLKNDIRKRLTKRNFVKLIFQNNNFCSIDRKVKAELVGLDGACIIKGKGEIVSFGAIITNDSGSSGGGRGAAAKKLSNYQGFSIKISTDGYIEVYSGLKKIYSIK